MELQFTPACLLEMPGKIACRVMVMYYRFPQIKFNALSTKLFFGIDRNTVSSMGCIPGFSIGEAVHRNWEGMGA